MFRSPICKAWGLALAATALLAAAPAGAIAAPRLERVVILIRHGVRPPTKPADQLAKYSDQAWPGDADWGAAPGDLTPHGFLEIQHMGAALRAFYAAQGLAAAQDGHGAGLWIWADGADERTRESGRAFALGFAPGAPPPVGSGPAGQRDLLFDGDGGAACPFDPAAAQAAGMARADFTAPAIPAALSRLQAIVAPKACDGGAGACLTGASKLVGQPDGVKVSGPAGIGATLAEDLLLEYETGLPMAQVGWGRLQPGDLATILPLQALSSDLTRRAPYIAVRRGGRLARFILAALAGQAPEAGDPPPPAGASLVVLAGHDTNLSNIAGALDLDWSLPGQPDPTAPGVALAFELWRDADTGQAVLRLHLFYQTPDEVRTLTVTPPHALPVNLPACSGQEACTVETTAHALEVRLAGCGAP